jgi:hypothetical protein
LIPEIPESLTQEELRGLYRAEDARAAAAFGLPAGDDEAWGRARKYAYARYWERRLADGRAITTDEVDEWKRFVGAAFMGNVAWGVVGDTARAGLLGEDSIADLERLPGATSYATRQLRARALLASPLVDEALVGALLDVRSAWALHELLSRPLEAEEFRAMEAAAADPRLSRADRHELRQALRKRARP